MLNSGFFRLMCVLQLRDSLTAIAKLCCRDFAARNCLINADMIVKVGDYGLSEEIYKVLQVREDDKVTSFFL